MLKCISITTIEVHSIQFEQSDCSFLNYTKYRTYKQFFGVNTYCKMIYTPTQHIRNYKNPFKTDYDWLQFSTKIY